MGNDKVRLMIELDKDKYRVITEMPNVYASELCEAIRNGTPVSTEGDTISREWVKAEFKRRAVDVRNWKIDALNNSNEESAIRADAVLAYLVEVKAVIDNAPPVPERTYLQGWHDAIGKALDEAIPITTEDGTFEFVQVETLDGLGLSMPTPDKESED